MTTTPLEIQLLGKEYKVACPPSERAALQAAAALLDQRLTEAAQGKVKGERLAVMVALNLAHELLAQNSAHNHNAISDRPLASEGNSLALDSDEVARKIASIETRIDATLNQA